MDGADELLERAYTQEQAEQDEQTKELLLLNEGTYRTLPALTLTERVSDRRMVQTAEGERGRVEYRYFAQVESENGADPFAAGSKGAVAFTISPDRVLTDRGRPDSASVLWTQAVNAYQLAVGQKPNTYRDVAEYVRDYRTRLRVGKIQANEKFPDPANFVRSLSAVRD